jgi:hypothetical protein
MIIKEVVDNLCNKVQINQYLSNGYIINKPLWIFNGITITYNNQEAIITEIQGNTITVDNIISTPLNYFFIQKPNVYNNERLVDVISRLPYDGFTFFLIDNEIKLINNTGNLQCQLTICVQYSTYDSHRQATRAASYLGITILNSLNRYTSSALLSINDMIITPNITASFEQELNLKFNAFHAAVIIDYIRS